MKQKLGEALITELKQQTHDRTAIAKFEQGDVVYYLTSWNTKYDLPKGYCVESTGYGRICTIDKYDLQYASRDKKFQKRWMVSIKLEKEFKSYLDSKAQEKEEQERLLQEQLQAEEKISYPLTSEQIAHVESISSEHLLNEFELLRREEQENEAALVYETPQDEWIVPIEQYKEIFDIDNDTIRDNDVEHSQNVLLEVRRQEEELEREFDEMRERLKYEQEFNEPVLETESKSQELSIDDIRLMEQWEQDREEARWELERDNEFDFCR